MAKTLTSKIGRSLCLLTITVDSKAQISIKSVPQISCLHRRITNFQRNSRYIGTNSPMMKSALVLIVDGSEEMEFTISADVLRRAGVTVTVAGVEGASPVKCSRDIVIVPDTSLTEAVKKGPYDAVVLPGGAGYKKFAASEEVGRVLKEQEEAGRLIAAICAAPSVLKTHSIGIGKNLTSYPSVKEELINDYNYKEDNVVIDGKLVTSRGPGTAFEFALAVAEQLTDKANVEQVKKGMLL